MEPYDEARFVPDYEEDVRVNEDRELANRKVGISQKKLGVGMATKRMATKRKACEAPETISDVSQVSSQNTKRRKKGVECEVCKDSVEPLQMPFFTSPLPPGSILSHLL
jgi:hypothetical protein